MADNTDQLLTRAWRRVNTATTGAERFRWLLIVAILEGYQCKPGSSTSAKAS